MHRGDRPNRRPVARLFARHPLRDLCLALSLGVVLSAVDACPSQREQATIGKGIRSGWKIADAGFPSIDYISFLPVPENPGQCVVLVSVTQDDAHANGGTISILELTANAGQWRQTFEQKEVLSLGSFGKAPEGHFLKLGQTANALGFEVTGMHFGYEGTDLVLLAKIAGNYQEILSLATHYDNNGAGEDALWQWDGTLEFLKGESEFPDIRVTYSGTEGRDQLVYPVNRTEIYTFVDHAYRRRQ